MKSLPTCPRAIRKADPEAAATADRLEIPMVPHHSASAPDPSNCETAREETGAFRLRQSGYRRTPSAMKILYDKTNPVFEDHEVFSALDGLRGDIADLERKHLQVVTAYSHAAKAARNGETAKERAGAHLRAVQAKMELRRVQNLLITAMKGFEVLARTLPIRIIPDGSGCELVPVQGSPFEEDYEGREYLPGAEELIRLLRGPRGWSARLFPYTTAAVIALAAGIIAASFLGSWPPWLLWGIMFFSMVVNGIIRLRASNWYDVDPAAFRKEYGHRLITGTVIGSCVFLLLAFT